jgi:methyltransferase (TIGR00027 family)
MAERDASLTARGVAALRAAHLLIDESPPILDDSVIVRLLGPVYESYIRAEVQRYQSPPARGLRSHVVLRSRVAEDALRDAVARGIEQYVLLGAGLDTFGYRQPAWAAGLAIIEVDHPSSQADKRRLLEAADMVIPPNVTYADVDFERETLAQGLGRCGVSFERPAFFSWLGVTM